MAMNVGGGSGGVKSDINVTPLVDVMLVLLIIMMIIAPLLQQGVSLKLPVATNSSEKPETPEDTVIHITADGQTHVNGQPVQIGDLRRRVEEVLETKAQRIIVVKADVDASYADVMSALDELRSAGIEDIGLITDRRTSGTGGGQ